MDSCQIFNFLFGTRKTTSELRKCFSNKINEVVTGAGKTTTTASSSGRSRLATEGTSATSQKDRSVLVASCKKDGCGSVSTTTITNPSYNNDEKNQFAESHTDELPMPPISPIKQIQMRLVQLVPSGSNFKVVAPNESASGKNYENKNSQSLATCDSNCGTYRALLVEPHDDNNVDHQDQVDRLSETNLVKENYDNQDNNNNNFNKNNYNNNYIPVSSDSSTSDCDQGRYYFRETSSQEHEDEPTITNESNATSNELARARKLLFRDKKNERVRNLVQSFELNSRPVITGDQPEPYEQLNDTGSASNIRQMDGVVSIQSRKLANNNSWIRNNSSSLDNNNSYIDDTQNIQSTPSKQSRVIRGPPSTAIVKPLPPKTPPKSVKAKCLNLQLILNKPIKLQQLFQDERFLCRLFDQMEPLDRCSAAQVCRQWRNVLYSKQSYWKDLINVIDCTQLRREHLVDCIINTLHQSAKLKQHQLNQQPQNKHQQAHNTCIPNHCNNHSINCDSIDQDEIWRIQELCNRFSRNPGQSPFNLPRSLISEPAASSVLVDSNNNNSNNEHQINNQQQHQQAAASCLANSKSSSIPSQISSTLSSISISSLLSPLSESIRLESIREKLYTSLDDRGFDAICLFGATDEDIEDFTSKSPLGTRQRIRGAKLNNCCFTDRGLEMFIKTFNQIDELELSGCNEITNAMDLRPLKNLTRLTITDCINIADGLAQRLIQIFHQLTVLTIQAYHLTDAFLEHISLNADTSNLRRLELLNCKELTNHSMLMIVKHFQTIESLSISGSTKISDDGIEILTEQAKQLRCLDLSWCTKITDASLECIACDLSSNLTELILDRNVHISDIGLGYLATMNNLELVHIRWCSRITDIGLESLLTIKSLRYLSLAGLQQVTARSLLCLIEADQLVEVELTNCPAVNGELLRFLSSKMPHCHLIY